MKITTTRNVHIRGKFHKKGSTVDVSEKDGKYLIAIEKAEEKAATKKTAQ